MSSIKLKPCPFCGGRAEIKVTPKYVRHGKSLTQYYVLCTNINCGLYVGTRDTDTKEEAVEIWNRRVTDGRV